MRLPISWEDADIVPIPKQKPITDVNKHLRPISLPYIISKIAEDHFVEVYVKPAVPKKIDHQQYGTIPKSSSTHAIISMIPKLYVSTDSNGATKRVMLFDFRKAFDLINHHILLEKLLTYDPPQPYLQETAYQASSQLSFRMALSSCWSPQGNKTGTLAFPYHG